MNRDYIEVVLPPKTLMDHPMCWLRMCHFNSFSGEILRNDANALIIVTQISKYHDKRITSEWMDEKLLYFHRIGSRLLISRCKFASIYKWKYNQSLWFHKLKYNLDVILTANCTHFIWFDRLFSYLIRRCLLDVAMSADISYDAKICTRKWCWLCEY